MSKEIEFLKKKNQELQNQLNNQINNNSENKTEENNKNTLTLNLERV
jgi:hypothetical protein